MNSYDLEDIEIKNPKCVLIGIIIGIVIEFSAIILINQ